MKKKNRMIARPAEPADQRCWTRFQYLPEYRAEITVLRGGRSRLRSRKYPSPAQPYRSSQGLNVALGDDAAGLLFQRYPLGDCAKVIARAEPIAAVGRAMARPEVNEDRLFAS